MRSVIRAVFMVQQHMEDFYRPFTPALLFETSRLWHFCKLNNQIILQAPKLLAKLHLAFIHRDTLGVLHNVFEIVIKSPLSQTLAESRYLIRMFSLA